MAILVTGCAGYIGSIASKILLEQGFEVVGLDNLSTGYEENIPQGVKFHKACISDQETLNTITKENNIDAVMHFAAYIEVGESVKKPEKYLENNFERSAELLKNLTNAGIQKLVYSSTAAVYGIPKEIPITEADLSNEEVLKPINPYGESKLKFEKLLRKTSEEKDFSYIALRYFNVAGAYGELGECHNPETHLIPLVIDAALGKREDIKIFGTDYETPNGTAIRDYIHVLDLVNAHTLALEALSKKDPKIINQAYNLGYGEGFSVKEVIDTVRRVSEVDFKVIESERREGDPPKLIAGSTKIKEKLNWEPKFNNLEQIVSDALTHRKNFFYKAGMPQALFN